MLFYFSGTGNSKWIATQLSFRLQEKLYFIPDLLRKQTFDFILNNDERIGFVFPVYSWSLPDIVSSFIKKLSLQNYRCQYCFFVCSCGDDIGLTKNIFIKMMASKGWRCHAGFSVIMPNNYVLLPGFDVDDKSLAQKKLVNAIGKLDKIVATLHIHKAVCLIVKRAVSLLRRQCLLTLYSIVFICHLKIFGLRVSVWGVAAALKYVQ